ncbi:MAG: Hpt domain-containing protein, partial [Gemmatimonadaceae bacterium]|nr:Hpt domain-containing protein [Chitinophagaceae bacterium]
KDPVKAALPIIALTANALKGDSEKYLAAGMTDYLSKPFTEENLFTVIKRNLKTDNMNSNSFGPAAQAASAANGSSTAALYDLTMVRSVSGGDESFLKKMVELFIETVPPGVNDLKQATVSEEWDKVGKQAHKLKSTIDSMGIESLKQDIRTVEANGKHQLNTEVIPGLVNRVDNVLAQVIDALKKDFSL